MKTLIFLVLLCSTAEAKEFKFTYTLGRDQLQYKTNAETWETAFKRGADFCFDFFTKKEPFSEDRWLEIIDTCANPR